MSWYLPLVMIPEFLMIVCDEKSLNRLNNNSDFKVA